MIALIREVHDPPAGEHSGIHRIIDLLKRYYYWSTMRKTVDQYIRNCYRCHRSKAPRDKHNGLLIPSEIPEQRWTDIAMDFITDLPESEGMNAICTIIDKLSKERHYVPCRASEEGTTAEATARILIQWVFRTHGLPTTITSDREPQFIATVWRSFCKQLGIRSKLSTAFHPETDGQTEHANQDIEKHLRIYCNYMQDDWIKYLSMTEFADNNAVAAETRMTPFFVNKGFHPRMSFTSDQIYETAKERVQAAKASDITGIIKNVLELAQTNMKQAQNSMKRFADRHRKEVSYQVGDRVFLSSRNIVTSRPSKKLEDKMLGPYTILRKVDESYELELPESLRVHPVFAPNLLRKDSNDPLPGQVQDSPPSIETPKGKEWELEDIVNSRWHYNRLQYQCQWTGERARDLQWYNTDGCEFEGSADIVKDFHDRHPRKSEEAHNLISKSNKRRIRLNV